MRLQVPGRLTWVEAAGTEVVVRTATGGADAAVARVRRLLDAGKPVTLVVDVARCSWETVELLARLNLAARRTAASLRIVLVDEDVRALVAFADLTDVLES